METKEKNPFKLLFVTQQFSILAKKNQHRGKWIHDFANIEKDIYFLKHPL